MGLASKDTGSTCSDTASETDDSSRSDGIESTMGIASKTAESTCSDTASETDDSSGSDVEQYLFEVASSPGRSFSLTDARIALSFVHRKMGKVLQKDFRHKDPPSMNRRGSKSRTYSSFHRPENNVVPHELELNNEDKLKNEGTKRFNIYASDVDFVERPLSVSMIEDVPSVTVLAAEEDASQSTRRSTVMFPSPPPTKPPPLQLHTSASTKYTSSYRRLKSNSSSKRDEESSIIPYLDATSDDDVSIATHVEIANMSSVVVHLENTNVKDCCDLLSHGT